MMNEMVCDHSVIFRKTFFSAIKLCYSSARDHPIIVAVSFFLLLLYRSFPSVFTFLISSLPVLICTALLLGTLLSFGQPNLHQSGDENDHNHEIGSLRTKFSEGKTVVERRGSFSAERLVLSDSLGSQEVCSEVPKGVLNASSLRNGVESGKQVNEEDECEYVNLETEQEEEAPTSDGGIYMPVHEEGGDEERNSITIQGNFVDADNDEWCRASPKHVEECDKDGDSASTSSESVEAESSPDASIPDVIPAHDELDRLLDSEAMPPSNRDHDVASDVSHKCNDGSHDSTEDSEDGEEDEREQEVRKNYVDDIKSAITWTEDDQKNLMDLGSLELERNRRLENLIVRRRARKNVRVMAEKNLIDLDTGDLPFPVAPISTSKHNPFDIPYDPNENGSIPPIPGSAPSVLLPGRNPFDIPHEDKPDVTNSGTNKDFMSLHDKGILFRRHESFNAGPIFRLPREGREEIKFTPFFVPEKFSPVEAGDPSNHSQSSESSDSKESSIIDEDSTSSTGHKDENILGEKLGPEFEDDVNQSCESVIPQSDLPLRDNEVGSGLYAQITMPTEESSSFRTEENSSDLKINGGERNPYVRDLDDEPSSESSSSSSSSESDHDGHTELDSSLKPTSIIINGTDIREPVYDSSPSSMPSALQVSASSSLLETTMPSILQGEKGDMESLTTDATMPVIEVILPHQPSGSSDASDLPVTEEQNQLVDVHSPVGLKASVVDLSPDDLKDTKDEAVMENLNAEASTGLEHPEEHTARLLVEGDPNEGVVSVEGKEVTLVENEGQVSSGSTHG